MNREVELRPRTLVTAWSGCGSLTTGLACAERGTRWASLQPRAREPSPRQLQSAAPPQTGHPGPERPPAPPLPSPLPGASALRPVPATCLTVNGLCRLASSTPRSVRGLLRPFSRPTFGRCREHRGAGFRAVGVLSPLGHVPGAEPLARVETGLAA